MNTNSENQGKSKHLRFFGVRPESAAQFRWVWIEVLSDVIDVLLHPDFRHHENEPLEIKHDRLKAILPFLPGQRFADGVAFET